MYQVQQSTLCAPLFAVRLDYGLYSLYKREIILLA